MYPGSFAFDVIEFVKVLPPIVPGSIISLRVDPIVNRTHIVLTDLIEAIKEKVGHDDFLVCVLPEGGQIDVVTAEEALVWIENYLDRSRIPFTP